MPLAVVVGAVMLAAVVGLLPRWSGLVHVVALPPLALVNDLGALLAWSDTAFTFVPGLLAVVAGRTVLLAALLGGITTRRLWFALRFQLVVLPFAFLAAALLYASMALLFYALFWFGLLVALALFLFTAATPWSAADGRLRSRFVESARHGFRAGTVGAYLAVLVALGYLADVTAPVGPVLLVPVSGAATWCAAWALHADPGWRWMRRSVAAVPASGIVALAVIVFTGPAGPPSQDEPEVSRDGSIMLMSGIDSSSGSGAILELDPHALGWTCERTYYYSYAGPGDGQPRNEAQCDIAHGASYEALDTLRSRDDLVPFLAAQVEEMQSPPVVAGHSQGAWLVWDAARLGLLPDDTAIVLVGPFPDNPLPYPDGDEAGPGHVGRAVLWFVAEVDRPGGTSVFEVDSPLGVEWLGHPHRIRATLAQPLPEAMPALSVPSAFDLPLMPEGPEVEGAVDACPVPVIHPNLPYASEFHDAVERFVDGQEQGTCPFWRTAIGPIFRPFSVPPASW
jgi:hypothetical protein